MKSAICYLLSCFLLVSCVNAIVADDVIPVDPPLRWWKGNLHTHTFWSDGDDFPEMVVEFYRTRDYNFLALSDHNLLSQGQKWKSVADLEKKGGPTVIPKYYARFGKNWIESRKTGDVEEIRLKPLDEFRALMEQRGKFLLIPAEEITDKAEGVPVHMNATNLLQPIEPLGGKTVVETINNNLRAVEDQAERFGREILAHLNHPNFGFAVTAEDLAHAVLDHHFEVYNGHPGVNQLGDANRPSIDRMWDIANTIRLVQLNVHPLYGIGTDDSHNYHDKPNGSRPGRGWQMVRARHLTPESILRAIAAGDSYASSGVTLRDVQFNPETKLLKLEIEPQADAKFVTQFIGSPRNVDVAGKPVLDKDGQPLKDKTGKPLRVSKAYSEQIGKVLATVEGLKPEYKLTGEELYVRAVVTSSLPPVDPAWKDQKAQAWTQPVGWKK